jgi:hypothetical protein
MKMTSFLQNFCQLDENSGYRITGNLLFVASNDRMTCMKRIGRIWKEAVVI